VDNNRNKPVQEKLVDSYIIILFPPPPSYASLGNLAICIDFHSRRDVLKSSTLWSKERRILWIKTYHTSNSTKQIYSWEAHSHSASQEIHLLLRVRRLTAELTRARHEPYPESLECSSHVHKLTESNDHNTKYLQLRIPFYMEIIKLPIWKHVKVHILWNDNKKVKLAFAKKLSSV
jgi:hypothetical protein